MELINLIISEQSLTDGKQGADYKNAGYVRIASALVNSKKANGDVKKDNTGKYWFKANAQQPQTTDLSQYVGSYKEGNVTGDVTLDNNVLRVKYKSLDTYLDSKGNDTFEFDFGSKGTVKFTKDSQGKVNGFDYKWAMMSGHAEKVGSSSSNTSSNNSTSTSNTTTATTDTPIPQNVTYVKYNDNPSERANTKGFRWKKCDNTFPIKYGCANDLIKDLNTCIFGENSSNVYGPALLNSLNDRARDTPNKEISKETYDALMSQCEAKNESINRKKIIKQTVKNILKESLLVS